MEKAIKRLSMVRLSSDSLVMLSSAAILIWTGSWRVRGLQCLSLPFTSNEEADQNNMPLHVAAFTGKAEVVLSLINDFACDPNVRGNRARGRLLLHNACQGGSVSLVKTLIREHKADVNGRSSGKVYS